MTNIAGYGLVAVALLACADSGRAQAPQSRAQTVVAASKRVTGGSAWDELQGCHEEGTHAAGAVAYRTWFSLRRYGIRMESRRGETGGAIGFNGTASWRTNGGGGVDIASEGDAVREAVTTAYLSSNGFFFPARFPAAFRYVREAAHGGRTYDVLEIAPEGGRPLEYWFDRTSHFLGRVVDRQGTPPVTVEATDYRRAGRVTVAFTLTTIGPDGAALDRGNLISFACGPIDAALFDPPAAP